MTAATAIPAARLSFADADALLFDPLEPNRASTQRALMVIGFGRIAVSADIGELPNVLSDRPFDLFVADITRHTERVCDLVRAIRDGQAGENPFLHVVLTAWKLEQDLVKRALNCGADDLITRPFAIDFLAARIRKHTEARKPFVVTSDYIGPDRRRTPERGTTEIFEVPNLLLAKTGTAGPECGHSSVKAMNESINAERARKCAFKIAFTLQCLRQNNASQIQDELDQLETAAKDLLTRAQGQEKEPVQHAVTALLAGLAPMQRGEPVAQHLDAMDNSARALIEVLYPSRNKDEILSEVAAAVINVCERSR
jgi:CheY-like chemotaxis protein